MPKLNQHFVIDCCEWTRSNWWHCHAPDLCSWFAWHIVLGHFGCFIQALFACCANLTCSSTSQFRRLFWISACCLPVQFKHAQSNMFGWVHFLENSSWSGRKQPSSIQTMKPRRSLYVHDIYIVLMTIELFYNNGSAFRENCPSSFPFLASWDEGRETDRIFQILGSVLPICRHDRQNSPKYPVRTVEFFWFRRSPSSSISRALPSSNQDLEIAAHLLAVPLSTDSREKVIASRSYLLGEQLSKR